MLTELRIKNFAIIESLTLPLSPGFNVLSGETGAGKSILLDALGLALGARAESGLLRAGASQASVTAEFELARHHALRDLLAEHGLDVDDSLLLRRQLGADGRSRAFVNDQPVGIGLLRQIGDSLVEIVGQFEQHGLLDPATHGEMLDMHGSHDRPGVAEAWRAWRETAAAREACSRRSSTGGSAERLTTSPGTEGLPDRPAISVRLMPGSKSKPTLFNKGCTSAIDPKRTSHSGRALSGFFRTPARLLGDRPARSGHIRP